MFASIFHDRETMSMQNHETIGDYTILNRLALGGMAEILLAKRQGPMGFAKPVVLKRLLPQLAADKMFTTMFLNEAKLAARLSHPNIVQINDLGQSGASFYIAMEYLAGEDLATIIRVMSARKARLPKHIAARIVADSANALHYAHELRDDEGNSLGIVHRDVSPQNIFLTTQGTVKVVDFGIAKCEDREVKTQTGIVKGKIEYMPPEQMTGKRVDHRADIYALGVVLYEA
ncbi:MAG: serine/threonine protein kinase, partial [Clostridia bacterium]|nr:serine/threonine protein kinase [Deltaproteobacteria bacterium]